MYPMNQSLGQIRLHLTLQYFILAFGTSSVKVSYRLFPLS